MDCGRWRRDCAHLDNSAWTIGMIVMVSRIALRNRRSRNPLRRDISIIRKCSRTIVRRLGPVCQLVSSSVMLAAESNKPNWPGRLAVHRSPDLRRNSCTARRRGEVAPYLCAALQRTSETPVPAPLPGSGQTPVWNQNLKYQLPSIGSQGTLAN